MDRELVARLIEVLAPCLDPATAWRTAELWPPDLSESDYRDFLVGTATKSSKARLATLHLLRSA